MELSKEILDPIQHAVQLAQPLLLLTPRRLGWAAYRLLARAGSLLLLSLDQPPALLFFLHHPLQTRLHLCGQVQHMPHIPLVRADRFGGAQSLGNGSTAIADRPRTVHPLFLQIPQRQCPTFPVHGHRRQRCPHLRTTDIDDIEIGFPSFAAVLFIQGQHASLL